MNGLFSFLLKNKLKTSVEASDLIVLGTKDKRKGFSLRYKETAIRADNLKSQIIDETLALIPPPTPTSVLYSNIAFVDSVNGNNITAVLGDFTKPFVSVPQAISAIAATSPTSTNRGLVYVRKGTYTSSITMQNFVDVYCDADAIFTSGQITVGSVTCNFLGNARFNTTGRMLLVNGTTDFNFEFDTIDSTAPSSFAMEVGTTSAGNVNISGRYIKTAVGAVGTMTLRGAANVTLNISESLEGFHEVINVRFASGRIVINCPSVRMLTGNTFGGNFKHGIIFYENSGVRCTLNGNLYNDDPTYYGGTAGMIATFANGTEHFTLNGDVYAGANLGMFIGAANALTTITVNGSIHSNTQCVYAASAATVVVKDGAIGYPSTGSFTPIRLETTTILYLINMNLHNQVTDGKMIEVTNASVNLNVHKCIFQSAGASGEFIFSTVGAINAKLIGSAGNKPLSVDVTDLVGGYISDADITTYYFKP